MGKNKDKKVQTPPPAPETKENKDKKVNVVQMGDLLDKMGQQAGSTTLSPDATVMALNGLKSMVHDNPNAAEYYGMSSDAVKNINHFTLIGFATVLANEIEQKKSPFAIRMLASNTEALNTLADITGVRIDIKALPTPNKEGIVEVPSGTIKVSTEAKKKIKEEQKIAKDAILDPTKIENEEQLKASLVAILSDMKEPRPFDRINKAVTFYTSYLTFLAGKDESTKAAKLKEIESMSTADTLRKVAEIAGASVYSLDGICRLLRKTVTDTNSPVSAYCLFRNASINPKTGTTIDDALVADIVKILIIWSSEAGIAEENQKIAESNRVSEKNKDNIGIVNAEKEKRERFEKNKEYYQSAIDIVSNPSMDLADKFEEAYDDDKHELHANVRRAGKNIFDTYYRGKNMNDVEKDLLKKNLKQYAGIILNMFRDPLSRSIEYTYGNLTEMFKPVTEEKPKEEKK